MMTERRWSPLTNCDPTPAARISPPFCASVIAMPKHASVTNKPCTCDLLQRVANDPFYPIVFDTDTNEYHFTWNDGALLVIGHCPFCGGAAPESKRALLFAQIPGPEESRLAKRLKGVTSMDDAINRFGKPDYDGTSTSQHDETEDAGQRIEHHRLIRYHELSDVAEIWITERPDGRVHWHLQGKHVGPNAP
jgi:hypothetical protein